jgi:hypothetical protein
MGRKISEKNNDAKLVCFWSSRGKTAYDVWEQAGKAEGD